MVIHHCLQFADERGSVKCLGSAAGVSFPSPLLLFCSFLPNALARLSCLKETETTATQAICFAGEFILERRLIFLILFCATNTKHYKSF